MNLIWLALGQIKGLGTKRIKKIYDAVPNLSVNDLQGGILRQIVKIVNNKSVAESLADKDALREYVFKAEEMVRIHQEQGIGIVAINDENYPDLLKQIDDPPIVLYCKGNVSLLRQTKNIAIVGTRNPSTSGEETAREIAASFCKMGYVIVSGLATGIDTEAHIGALKAGGNTIAVLGHGLDTVFPKENSRLAKEIVEKEGLLVSEYPLRTPSFRASFVQRDRIQSGMSLAVCPVQTDVEGGTQHTIKFSRKQGRLLFCPVPTEDIPATQGIKKLLMEGAVPLSKESDYNKIDDILILFQNNYIYSPEKEDKTNMNQQINLFD